MKELENLVDQFLPKVSVEDVTIAISVLVEKSNEECKKLAIEDPLHKQMKEVWMQLQNDIFEYGFMAEFAEFMLENPGLDIFELDRQFRNEWDL